MRTTILVFFMVMALLSFISTITYAYPSKEQKEQFSMIDLLTNVEAINVRKMHIFAMLCGFFGALLIVGYKLL